MSELQLIHFSSLYILNVHMTVRADISHSFIYHNVARPNHVGSCKALPKDPHSITLIYRGAVWPFRSLFLSSVSPSSHCPSQLPSGNVPNPCSPISISKGEVSPRELLVGNFRNYYDKDNISSVWQGWVWLRFNWAIFIGFTLVLSVRSSTNCKSLYQRRFFSAFRCRCQNCEEVLCTILIWRTGLVT